MQADLHEKAIAGRTGRLLDRRRVVLGAALLCALPASAPGQEASSPEQDPRLLHMVLVAAGEFRMGSLEHDDFADGDEKPQRTLRLDAFYIDKLEVTNIEYKRFTDATGHPVPEGWREGRYPEGADFYPVHSISWWEAMAYARWVGKRLPTEAEWEKAARGTDARRFPWGDEFDIERANADKDFAPVASYFDAASPYGALNMAGNVAEWTASAYAPYPDVQLAVPVEFGGTADTGDLPRSRSDAAVFRAVGDRELERARDHHDADDPLLKFFSYEELADRRDRVYRGGSVNNYARFLRCANREESAPQHRWYNVGFRCAMDPPQATADTAPAAGTDDEPRAPAEPRSGKVPSGTPESERHD